jgi:hypothetical protein
MAIATFKVRPCAEFREVGSSEEETTTADLQHGGRTVVHPNLLCASIGWQRNRNGYDVAPGYANGTGIMTLDPSGFALQASDFTTHLTDNPTTITVVPAALVPTFLNVYAVEQLRPNQPNTKATLTLTDQSGTSPVGKITLNPVTFQGDDNPNSQTTSFQPLNAGSTLIKITSPAGFTNASTQVTATVVP